MPDEETLNPWWTDLRHGGMIISPAVLDETFPSGADSVNGRPYQKLRDAWNRFEAWLSSPHSDSGGAAPLYRWLDAVLEDYLGHPADRWQKGPHVDDRFKAETLAGQRLRANRVLMRDGADEPALLLMVDRNSRVGIGRGRRAYANLLHLLRETGHKLGLLTNGVQFRLVYAGLDHDAWVEWDAEAWFAEGERRRQLGGLITLLGEQGMQSRDGLAFPLLDAVETSRDKQGELSQVMGEQVRRAIEIVLAHVDRAARANPELLDDLRHNPETGEPLDEDEWLAALFQAATRVVMRLVVALFAEARDLLPKSLESYYHSYSVEGLFEQLTNAEANEGTSGLEEGRYAWSRLMSLFTLIHEGSSHPDLPVPEYGGTLFRRGDGDARDPILRALAIFESDDFEMPDLAVLKVLRLLKIGRVKAQRGRSARWVSGPVDFSDLRTEYIGMIYEGLLDFQLRQVSEDQGAVVFLDIGQQPALPLSLLAGMDDDALDDLLGTLKSEKAKGPDLSQDEEEDEELEEIEELEEEAEDEDEPDVEREEEDLTEREELRLQVHEWAVRAVKVAGLVREPRGKDPDWDAYEEDCREEAVRLIQQIVAPGEMYLVRSGGTRKGTGTFYTRPQLAVPTTHRTLKPLAYDVQQEDEPPRPPAEILSLKVCDPAMGSGSFPVAALRYLTDALYQSLQYHGHIREAEAGTVISLPFGEKATGEPYEETLPVPPDDERFADMLKARLKRHVVERCIYGVDINPMAVELARLSLWIETMDRELPFEFLDHKLKVGNSLIGCWLDRYRDYPARAWERDAGDSGADYRAVNFSKGEISQRIKDTRNDVVKDELRSWIEARGPQQVMRFGDEQETGREVQEDAREQFERIHDMPRHLREDAYRQWQQGDEVEQLRDAFDRWCAIWFWPMEDESAPRLTPARFHEDDERIAEIAREVAREQKFFHWELEFPDVFTPDSRGFDAVLGNPPWETVQPETREFFTRYDPIYRTRGRQEALDVQEELFERDPDIERRWLRYVSGIKGLSNWVKEGADPFDFPLRGKGQKAVKETWERIRNRREGIAHQDHPFRHQGGGKVYTYKLFLEVSHHLMREGGRLGMLVPSGLYTDMGSGDLRELFLEECRWEWLFGFENRKGIFRIHRSFKFCPIIIKRDGRTDELRAAFMRHDLEDWEDRDPRTLPVSREQVERFSPETLSFLEFTNERELEIADTIYGDNPLLGDEGPDAWNVEFSQELNRTSDRQVFPPLSDWRDQGYAPASYGRWANDEGEIALPVYEGRMVGQFDFSKKGWVSGRGRGADWRVIPWNDKQMEPQYMMSENEYLRHDKVIRAPRITYMRVGSATNTRTMIATVITTLPSCDKAPTISGLDIASSLHLCAYLNSFAYDFVMRRKCGSLTLDFHTVSATPSPRAVPAESRSRLVKCAAELAMPHRMFAREWLRLRAEYPGLEETPWQQLWAIDDARRLRLRCMIDAIVAELYGLSYDDFAYILRIDPDDPKGFWRVDKNLPEEQRQTTLTVQAFRHLKDVGLEAFCERGWELPEHARRFREDRQQFVWEATEDWSDCERHAHNIIGEAGWADFQRELEAIARGEPLADPTRDQQELPDMPDGPQGRLL